MLKSFERTIHEHRGNVNEIGLHTPAVNLHTGLSSMGSKQIDKEATFDEMSVSLGNAAIKSSIISGLCGHNRGMVTSKHGSLKLNIPERAIKQGELIKLHIATHLYSYMVPFKLPGSQTNLAF